MYDRHGRCPTLPHAAWMHQKGTDALLSAIENADGDSVELSMVPDRVSEAERIDRDMEQRGGLLRAIEGPADASDSLDYGCGGKHYPGNTLGWGWLFIVGAVVLAVLAIVRIGGGW